MRFRHEQKYDAPREDVYAMLADPAFREKVCWAQNATICTVDIEHRKPGLSVTVDQTRPSDGIPSFARKIVGDQIQVVQREVWSDPVQAALAVTIPGKPGELDGTVTITGNGTGTAQIIAGELKVTIPLMGAKLERLIADLLEEALTIEQQVGRSWLAGAR